MNSPDNPEKKIVTIRVTEEQFIHIINAIEIVDRISAGQLESLQDILPQRVDQSLIRDIKEQAFPELAFNESYGWRGGYNGSTNAEYNKAFSRRQAMLYALWREMEHQYTVYKGHHNVYSSTTLRTEGIPLPEVSFNN